MGIGIGAGFGSAMCGGAVETPDGRMPEGGRRRARLGCAGSGIALWALALLTGFHAPAYLPADVNGVHGLTVEARRDGGVPYFAVGQPVEVRFDVSEKGFVSLWSRDADSVLERIVPSGSMPGMPVSPLPRGGRRTYCFGCIIRHKFDGEFGGEMTIYPGTYNFVAQEPVGRSELLLFWTSGPEEQPDTDAVAERAKATLIFQYVIVDGFINGKPTGTQEKEDSNADNYYR